MKTLVVVGGGAAGFFCAINAKLLAPSLQVIVLEKSSKLLSKVRISGGGRCNVTHHEFEPQQLVKNYPRGQQLLKKIFYGFNATHTVNWFAERGVELVAEADGRMFPTTNSSSTIIDCFLTEAEKLGIQVRTNAGVTKVQPESNGQVQVALANNDVLTSDFLVLACGGFPQWLQYQWLDNLALNIVPPVPSLFTFNVEKHILKELMGVSVSSASVQLKGSKHIQQGPILITHWGISGPAAIKLSAWLALDLAKLNYEYTVVVNWLSISFEQAMEAARKFKATHPKQKISKCIFPEIPQRLWDWFLVQAKVDVAQNWADINLKNWQQVVQLLTQFELVCKGKTTYKEEFVTAGGIDVAEINTATMQLKKWPAIFVAGELLNADGITGGFNFQNAWSTAYTAAKAIAKMADVKADAGN